MPTVICINQRHTIRPSSSISITIVRSGIVARINQRQPIRVSSFTPTTVIRSSRCCLINQRQPTHPSSSAPATVIRSGRCRPHQSTPTDSRVVLHSDCYCSFSPPSSASINVNRVARRHPLRQPSFVQAAVIHSDQRQPIRASSFTPTTIILQATVARINQRQLSCPLSSASTSAIRFARRYLFRHPSSVQTAVARINQRQPIRPPSSAPTTVVRSDHRRLHQSTPTDSRVVIHSDNRHPFRTSSPASINAIAPTASMRFKQHHPLHPPLFAPAARCAARTLFSHGRRRGDCLGKGRLR